MNGFLFQRLHFFLCTIGNLVFGHIKNIIYHPEVQILSINEILLDEPMGLKEWVENSGHWIATNDYKVVLTLYYSLEEGHKERLGKNKKSFEQRFFSAAEIRSVKYRVSEFTIDPLKFYLENEVESFKIIKEITYVR